MFCLGVGLEFYNITMIAKQHLSGAEKKGTKKRTTDQFIFSRANLNHI